MAERVTEPATPSLADLVGRLDGLTLVDADRLGRRLERVGGARDPRTRARALAELAEQVAAAEARVERRRAAVPTISYPAELPVSQRRDDLLAALRDHQVVVVAGETGSGKTTQLPKLLLELGRGVRGTIGHTQPRRIAARSVAERIAEETGTELGTTVGWKVRFTDHVSDRTLVKLMTDGILLAELQTDRLLRQYDTIVVDEAHERSLNVDFLLGYLAQLLPRRPDLKVVITSATIDPQRFADHFGGAPVVEVSGRTYPVEVRYRPVVDPDAPPAERDEDRDQVSAICDAVEELRREGPGDVLVFLSGEREIRDTADALRRLHLRDAGREVEVLPLYGRLSAAEQHRVFERHDGRRVVLATNVAETSLTVPGIRYVVDPGTARISRYSTRRRVQRLPIEPVSQASARQRAGRCGRTEAGIAIRLYTEVDYESRPAFTDPEILRTNLAAVILQMAALGLGDVEAFPFLDPPDRRNVRDGIALLEELGALDPRVVGDPAGPGRLTDVGRQLAQLPVDPRMGRMVVEAARLGVLAEVLVVAAALSIQDPRERPTDAEGAADAMHARFADPTSDFLGFLNLWRYLEEQQDALSSSAFRRLCKREHLNWLRVREWQDLVAQLRQVARSIGLHPGSVRTEAPDPERFHSALLAGLLSHLGLRDPEARDYLGARGTRFAVFPGSALFRKPPRWVVAAELVETTRLWARTNARIQPEWVEPLAGHLVQRSYSEPRWDRRRGSVLATEKVVLYGLPIVPARTVQYGRIDPVVSRELFIRHALVEGDWDTRHRFAAANRALVEELSELEDRARRRGLLAGEDALFDFFDARVPADVVSSRHFDTWWKRERQQQPDLLTYTRALLLGDTASGVSEVELPEVWRAGGVELPLTYVFDPGSPRDGVTADVPLTVLNQLEVAPFTWQVPGLRHELVTALIRSLPKAVRRSFVPAPNFATTVLQRMTAYDGPLLPALERELRSLGGPPIGREDWDLDRVPEHLRMTFRVVDEGGRELAVGKDLDELRHRLRGRLRAALAVDASSVERAGLTSWTVGTLPRTFEARRGSHIARAFPALVDEGASVAVRLFDTPAEQEAAMRRGTRRLLLLQAGSPAQWLAGQLSTPEKLALSGSPHGSVAALLDDVAGAAVDAVVAEAGGPAWDEAAYGRLLERVRQRLRPLALDVARRTADVLTAAREVEAELGRTTSLALVGALTDLRQWLARLLPPGFVAAAGAARLPDLLRYLRAAQRRLERLPYAVGSDADRMRVVQDLERAYEEHRAAVPAGRPAPPELEEVRWMLEELRVSLWAQTLGTAQPVSEQRIRKALARLPAITFP